MKCWARTAWRLLSTTSYLLEFILQAKPTCLIVRESGLQYQLHNKSWKTPRNRRVPYHESGWSRTS